MATKKPKRKTKEPKLPQGKLNSAAKALGLTEADAIAALRSLKSEKPGEVRRVPLGKKSFTFGYFSDAHIGHKKFNDEMFDYMVRFFRAEKPDMILNPGDHLEGMSGRPGHVYELAQIGFDQQIERAKQLYSQLDQFDHYGIDGNHDQWYYIKGDNGTVVGKALEAGVTNYHHLGQDEGNLNIDGVKIRLFHANDGTAYATSYKLQKLIESFSGGEKPHIVLSGHYHKAMNAFIRGVHGFECGTLCGQSKFMRGKKIPAHMGFGLVKVVHNAQGVERLTHTFVPWHEKQQ